MRLETSRKLAAHAAVGFSFASISIEGDIPLPIGVLFAGVLVTSFVTEGRLGRGRGGLFTALTGVALIGLCSLWLTGALDLVVAASLFAAALAANRLLSRQRAADDGLLYLSSLLMLAGGAALSAELVYGLLFAGFALSMTAALTLSHLSRVVEEQHAPPSAADRLASRRLLAGLGGLACAALLGAILLFFAFPRFTFGAFHRRDHGGRNASVGFSEQLRLDVHGIAKDDPRPAMRYRVSPDPRREQLDLLWKGKSFDLYDGMGWRSNAPIGELKRKAGFAEPSEADASYEVQVLPAAGTSVLFYTGTASMLGMPRYLQHRPRAQTLFLTVNGIGDVRLRPETEDGFAYELHSRPEPGDRELLGRGAEYPEPVRRLYLQLPEGLDPRIPELASRLTAGLTDPLEKARAIERALAKYAYTTELAGPVSDPLAYFLFERKAGHCELFSTAMTVLLRASGVPARNVTGFVGGARDDEGWYVVRGGDAHSWVEVYFPGAGFVAFDPTPPEGRRATPSPWLARLVDLYERASGPWRNLVVELSFWDQLRAVRSTFRNIASGLSRFQGRTGRGAAGLLDLLGAGIVVGLGLWLARKLWRSSPVASRRASWREDRAAAELYRQLQRALRRRGFRRSPGQTPRELAAAVARAGAPGAEAVSQITERYLASRFGGEPLQADEAARLRALLRTL